MAEWKFARRQGACATCEQVFADGDRHASALAVVGEELLREDVCLGCWGARGAGADLIWWFTRHQIGRRGLQLDLALIEQLFLSLEGRSEARLSELRYLMCLLLMRKRRLKIERIVRGAPGAGEVMIVRRPRRQESLCVAVFDFTPERLDALRGDLLRLFEGAEPAASSAAQEGTGPPAEEAGEGGAERPQVGCPGRPPERSEGRVAARGDARPRCQQEKRKKIVCAR